MKYQKLSGTATIVTFAILSLAAGAYWFSTQAAASSQEHRPMVASPRYRIYDLGIVQAGDTASQGFGVSPNGMAVGRSFRPGNAGAQAFSWTTGGGIVGLPLLAGRTFAVANSANNNGVIVGTAASTSFGSSRLPVIWQGGTVNQLPLPAGQTLGDAYSVNASGAAVGSVDAGTTQRGAIYSGGTGTIITQTTSTGCYWVTAYGINDSGRVAGIGWDPGNAARNVGMVYDIGSNTSFEVGGMPGTNGAINFAISNAGHVVGSTMMNQGSGVPFIWTQAGGMVAIPLATGTTQGSARGVNSRGWVVGQDSSAFSIPFLYDGTTTYRLADLIPAGTGWDLSTNTSSSALGISESNIIVGTGVYNGNVHGYMMVPVTNTAFDYDGDNQADVSVFRPGNGTWYLQRSMLGFGAVNWGDGSVDKIVPADYDGDGKTDVAVYRPTQGNWYVLRSSNGTLFAQNFGISEDLPVPADFDGDGIADVAVFRPSTGMWWILRSSGGVIGAHFGTSEDKPLIGDFNGDGKSDLCVFRPSNGMWYYSSDLIDPSHHFASVNFGLSTDVPTPGDFDGDLRTDIAVYRPSNGVWFRLNSSNGAFNAVQFGTSEDIPVAADFDGDGRVDASDFRPSSGVWYRLNSSNGSFFAAQFGTNGDRPTPAAFRY